MKTLRTLLIINLAMLVFATLGFTQPPKAPEMQATLLKFFNDAPSVVQAAPSGLSKQGNAPLQLAKPVRPAVKGKSPEDLTMEKLPKAVPPGQRRRPSKTELLDKCNKNPNCRGKLQAIKAKQVKPRPAFRGDPPEEQERKKLPEPGKSRGPRSGLMLPEESHSFLAWLNPFQVDTAHAQTDVSVYLTPGGPYGSNYMYVYGAVLYSNNQFWISSYNSWNTTVSENKPYVFFKFLAPHTGNYLINVEASRSIAKLRHQYSGPIIDTWDFRSLPYGTYDYLTAEYLMRGAHYFYFWPIENNGLYIYSVSLESY